MEEGVFRGLFIKLALNKYSFTKANLLGALFFGLWNIVMPLRSFIDGKISFSDMMFMSLSYIILSGSMGLKWGMMFHGTGVLWVGISEHFFKNIISNLLHVTTISGSDELQIIRIITAQLMSFVAVFIWYKIKTKKELSGGSI